MSRNAYLLNSQIAGPLKKKQQQQNQTKHKTTSDPNFNRNFFSKNLNGVSSYFRAAGPSFSEVYECSGNNL